MQVELRHNPSYAVARLHLAPGEQFLGEAGVMVMQSFGVTVQSQMQGGFMSALKRSALGGESFFVTTFSGHPQQLLVVGTGSRQMLRHRIRAVEARVLDSCSSVLRTECV